MGHKVIFSAAATALLLFGVGASAQEFIISAEQQIGTGGLGGSSNFHAGINDVACDASGTVHVIWALSTGIHYKKKPLSGVWSAEEIVPSSSNPTLYFGARIAVSDAGEVHVTWNGPHPNWTNLYYCMRTSSGWQARQTVVSSTDGTHRSEPQPTVTPDGTVHVLYFYFNPSNSSDPAIWYEIDKSGSTWGSPFAIPNVPVNAEIDSVTHDGTGKLYEAGFAGATTYTFYSIWNGSWGAISKPFTGITAQYNYKPDLAVGPGSALALVCSSFDKVGTTWPLNGIWSWTIGGSPIKLTQAATMTSTSRTPDPQPRMVWDSLGNQYVVWTDGDVLRYAIRRVDGTWATKDQNFPVGGGNQYYPDIAVAGNVTHVVWEDSRGGTYYATITPGSAPPVTTQVSIDMGTTNVENGLTNPQDGDGHTSAVTMAGRDCRQNSDPSTYHYFYFAIDDSFAYQGSRPVVDVTFDYYDTGSGTLKLQYDSSDTSWTPNPKYKTAGTVALVGDDAWKQATFHITDAYFGNQENGQADFRIAGPNPGTFYIDTVTVSGPPAKAANPSPSDQATSAAINSVLSWSAAAGATSYDVYFGTSSPGDFRGKQFSTLFSPGTLAYDTTYYWRIDSKGTNGTTTGDVWSFTTASSTPTGVTLGISSDGRFFTINGTPTFLHGISYYGSQSISTSSWVTQDLDDIAARGFNWLRTWVYWPTEYSVDVSVMTTDGTTWREPYHSRLITLIQACNARGIIVDCTFERILDGTSPGPTNQTQHLAAVRKLAAELLPYRNVYFDVDNESNHAGVYASLAEIGELIDAIHAIDPGRLCTASRDLPDQATLGDFLNIGHMDFIATHLCRTSSDCPAQNFSEVQSYIGWMSSLGVRVPVHLQEPMRRGIVKTFNPVAEDYYRDETDAKIVEAAGWCFHNGDNCKYSTDCRPFRSFTMTDADGRLFDQLDSVEQTTATGLMGQIGSTDVNVRRYQAEYAEQLSHAVGRQDGLAWTASVSADAAGLMTSGPLLDGVPAGDHLVEWRLKINNNTSDNDGMVTLTVRGGGAPLASLTVNRQDFTAANTYQTFPLTFTSTGQQDLEFRTNWLDKADMWCDWIQLTIGGGNLSPPVIAEVSPDPDIARPGTPYIRTLALLQGTPAPTWLVVQGPAGTQVNTSGVVSGWTPTLADLGTLVTFEIRAANSQGSDTETWQVLVRSAADFDGDGDVDQADFGLLQACFTPMGGPLPAGCEHVNLDGDPDIDQDDFNLFMPCVGGPNAPPGC